MGPFATWCLVAALIVLILWLLYELANPATQWVDDEPVEHSPVDHDPTGGAA